MKLSQKINNLLIFCLGILIGIVSIVVFKKWSHFTIDNKLDVVAIVSLLVNILLVLYVAYILDRRKEVNKIEKDIYIERVDSYYRGIYSKITKLIECEPIDYVSAAAASKIMRMRLHSILDFGVEKKLLLRTCENYEKVKDSTNDIWQLLTDDRTQTFEVKVSEIERKLIETENQIFSLISHVNHLNKVK